MRASNPKIPDGPQTPIVVELSRCTRSPVVSATETVNPNLPMASCKNRSWKRYPPHKEPGCAAGCSCLCISIRERGDTR